MVYSLYYTKDIDLVKVYFLVAEKSSEKKGNLKSPQNTSEQILNKL